MECVPILYASGIISKICLKNIGGIKAMVTTKLSNIRKFHATFVPIAEGLLLYELEQTIGIYEMILLIYENWLFSGPKEAQFARWLKNTESVPKQSELD